MAFITRQEAGQRLGEHLARLGARADMVVGLPRGGVVVAAAVARTLRLPLDVLSVRKLGHPWHREFAVGALAEGEIVVLDERALGKQAGARTELKQVIVEERQRLREYQKRFSRATSISRAGKAVLIVDDGLATGATAEAAVKAVRGQGAGRVIVAVPVASTNALDRLAPVADQVIALVADPDFDAVGRYYQRFPQTTDEEVVALLRSSEQGGS